MSNKSITSIVLVVIGVVISFFTSLSGLDVGADNPYYAIGVALPGIFMAIIVGLVVGLVAHLFSKERTRSKFFLVFSIFFLLTILTIAYGMS